MEGDFIYVPRDILDSVLDYLPYTLSSEYLQEENDLADIEELERISKIYPSIDVALYKRAPYSDIEFMLKNSDVFDLDGQYPILPLLANLSNVNLLEDIIDTYHIQPDDVQIIAEETIYNDKLGTLSYLIDRYDNLNILDIALHLRLNYNNRIARYLFHRYPLLKKEVQNMLAII